MLSRSTQREQEIKAERFIFGCYARSFSPPRIRNLADALTNLDTLGACVLASEIDHVIGEAASEKLLQTISQPETLPIRVRDHKKQGRLS